MDSSTPFRLPRKTPFGIGENVAEWATGLNQLDKFYAQRPVNADTKTFLRFTLDILGIDYRIAHGSLDSVPKQGATVIVANSTNKPIQSVRVCVDTKKSSKPPAIDPGTRQVVTRTLSF